MTMLDRWLARWDRWWPHLPYAVCLAGGLLLRLVHLAQRPLSSAEAAASWSAWSLATGSAMVPVADAVPDSAALFGLQSAIFWLVEGGDAAARVVPALTGGLLVLVPWMLRRTIGRAASIALAVLLAFDPFLVGYSRVADGAALTAAAAWTIILCAAALSAPDVPHARRRTFAAAMWMAAGVFLISGPRAWDLVVPLALLVAVLYPARSRAPISTGTAAAFAGATAGIVATSGLTQWDGLPLVSVSVTGWLGEWTVFSGTSFGALWRDLIRVEVLPLIVGTAGVMAGLASARTRAADTPAGPLFPHRAFIALAIWILWGVLLSARPGRELSVWLVLQPPLLLGVCYVAVRVAGWVGADSSVASWRGRIACGAIALGVLPLVGGSVRISADHRSDAFRPQTDVTEPGVRHLAADIAVSTSGRPAEIEIVAPRGADPVLGWELRAHAGVRWVAASSPSVIGGRRYVLSLTTTSTDVAEIDRSTYPVRRLRRERQHARLDTGGSSWP